MGACIPSQSSLLQSHEEHEILQTLTLQRFLDQCTNPSFLHNVHLQHCGMSIVHEYAIATFINEKKKPCSTT